MNKLMNLALRRNIFYPSAEIYSNIPGGFFDYGPIGTKIKNNLINYWRKELVEKTFDGLEISGSTLLPEPVWIASGHLKGFSDPVVKCSKCGIFYRADKLLESSGETDVGEKTDLKVIDELIVKHNLKCEKCKSKLENSFRFNIMFKTFAGVGEGSPVYLRGEACQNIFLDFKRVYANARRNLPVAIAQIGRAFRNEISPRNGLIRGREFDQMDIEMFFDKDNIDKFPVKEYDDLEIPVKLLDSNKELEFLKIKDLKKKGILKYNVEIYHLVKIHEFFMKLGLNPELFRWRQVSQEDRPFYSLATWDPEAKVEDIGWIEIMAFNYRTDYDLTGHQKQSGTNLEVMSEDKKVLPHIMEMSMGTDRIVYCLMAQNYTELNEKCLLKLIPELSPYDFAIFPLVNKDGIDKRSEELYKELSCNAYNIIYDDKGSIGKRYARIDEIGIRYAITVDYDTLKDNTVTLRDSWTAQQTRLNITELNNKLFNLKYQKNLLKASYPILKDGV